MARKEIGYRGFQSQTLDDLIDSAASANLDLQACAVPVFSRRMHVHAKAGPPQLLPSLDATPNGEPTTRGIPRKGGGHEFDWTGDADREL